MTPRWLILVAVAAASAVAQEGDLPPPLFEGGDAPVTSTGPTEVAEDADEVRTRLTRYYDALAERRLLAAETGSSERLRALVRRGEDLYLDARHEEAQRVLYEAVESPRFRDFADLDEYRAAEFMLAGSLAALGALRTSWRYLERILRRGEDDPYFGPAYRRAVDVSLQSPDLAAAVLRLEDVVPPEVLPSDAANELRYLVGRAHYDRQEWAAALRELEQVGRDSRFYANARYLQGAIAAQAGELEEAEGHFCAIASTSDRDAFTFYVDRRYFELRDLTWLALGRVAHEGRRGEDAFYYYFQVPQDSARVGEALFEAAWSMYESDDHDTAVDLLDQLETRFPDSASAHEASLLRGYIHLSRCEFEEASRLFTRFQGRFAPVVREIDRILANPSRRDRLFEELLTGQSRREAALAATRDPESREAPGEGAETPRDVGPLLLSLLRVDPAFYRLYAEIRTLDAEAARAARTAEELGAIAARLDGTDAPRAAVADDGFVDEVAALRRDLGGGRLALRALTEQLDAMRRAGAAEDRLAPLEASLVELSTRLEGLEGRLAEAEAEPEPAPPPGEVLEEAADLEAMLRLDRQRALAFDRRVADVRGRMITAANETALRALRRLRRDLGSFLRRSRIGRIDAVMGSKRRIEIQIESLAAGRFPPELQDPLSIQGLLRDDEEYWPFEGEYWADEFEEDPAEDDGDVLAETSEADGDGEAEDGAVGEVPEEARDEEETPR
jgi:hypothetical protein